MLREQENEKADLTKVKGSQRDATNYSKKNNERTTYLQYIILKIPAKTRGKREIVPFFSSTLSIIKIAIIDVKATVICSNKYNNKDSPFQSSTLL
jgi:hypothetical protein